VTKDQSEHQIPAYKVLFFFLEPSRLIIESLTKLYLRSHFCKAFFIELLKLHGDLFKNHVVLSESACLISEQVLHTSQLLGYCRITHNALLDSLVVLNQPRVVYLGQVQINSHRDRNNRA
jgi:O-phosphoseryl-tRNA(Cys) synthetase